LVGGLGPDKGFRVLVVMLDKVADGVLQLQRAAVDSAPNLFFGQRGEPALDQVQPGSRSGSEMQVEARTFGQPAADQLGIVGAVVIEDEMYVKFRGHVVLDGVEKAAELAGAMPAMQLAQHLAAGHIEGGKQAGGAVTFVIVAAAFDLSGAHGPGRNPIEANFEPLAALLWAEEVAESGPQSALQARMYSFGNGM